MFSRPVDRVSNTSIFGRLEGDTQWLAYEMRFSASEDLAMTLPLPVLLGSGEQAVKFLSLEGYPDFFQDMNAGFPLPVMRGPPRPALRAAPRLEVHTVGAFEASYVPTVKDFSRLDPRFRLPDEVWSQLKGYADHGFVVARLRAGSEVKPHPLAFSFLTRKPGKIFFPTVHVHDGEVHRKAEFDHSLYFQRGPASSQRPKDGEECSPTPAQHFMKLERAAGLLLKDQPCFRMRLRGSLPNQDTWARA
jgi:hypothetical protein